MDRRGNPWLDGCNKLLSHSKREWIHVFILLMEVHKEILTTKNPWSLH
jgi:hypothetical protein